LAATDLFCPLNNTFSKSISMYAFVSWNKMFMSMERGVLKDICFHFLWILKQITKNVVTESHKNISFRFGVQNPSSILLGVFLLEAISLCFWESKDCLLSLAHSPFLVLWSQLLLFTLILLPLSSKDPNEPGIVVYTYNPNYMKGREREDHSSRTDWAKR
jgi:hypothetical protein